MFDNDDRNLHNGICEVCEDVEATHQVYLIEYSALVNVCKACYEVYQSEDPGIYLIE